MKYLIGILLSTFIMGILAHQPALANKKKELQYARETCLKANPKLSEKQLQECIYKFTQRK